MIFSHCSCCTIKNTEDIFSEVRIKDLIIIFHISGSYSYLCFVMFPTAYQMSAVAKTIGESYAVKIGVHSLPYLRMILYKENQHFITSIPKTRNSCKPFQNGNYNLELE